MTLPSNWSVRTIGDICTFNRGLTYKKNDEVDYSDNPVLRANNVSLQSGKLVLDPIRYISDGISIPTDKRVQQGSLLICTASGSKSHLGKVAYIDTNIPYAFGGFMGMLTPNDDVEGKYLYWFLQSKYYFDFIAGIADGTNINNLKFSQLSILPVPLPPLAEQKRIVATLDESFAGIDAAIANTEKNMAGVWGLFDSYHESVFRGFIATCSEVALSTHTRFIDYRGRTPRKATSGLRLITAKNVRMGFLQRAPEEFVEPETYDTWMKRGIPYRGDVLFTTEAPLGFVCQLDTSDKVVLAQRIITIQPDRDTLDPVYLKYALMSPPIQKRIHEQATGATATGIKSSLLKKISIPLPELAEQRVVAEKLEQLERECYQLASLYEKKKKLLLELKQSLLQKAFAGELTAGTTETEAREATA